jgi:hypothetical protein
MPQLQRLELRPRSSSAAVWIDDEEFCVAIWLVNEGDFLIVWPAKRPDALTCFRVGQEVTEAASGLSDIIGVPVWKTA